MTVTEAEVDSTGAASDASTEAGGQQRPTSLRARQQLRTRQDLVRATLEVINATGMDNATVQRITHAAGMSRATLYAHFPDGRPELLAEAYQALGRKLIRTAEGYRTQAATGTDRICAYAQAMLDLASQRELGLFYNVSGPQLVGMKRRGIGSQTTLNNITTELEHAQSQGRVDTDLDVESIAALLVGAIREAGIDASRDPSVAPRRLTAFRQLVRALFSPQDT
ncbi:MAG: TetR family transcriptional regulator [Citricoccus sp.]|nr:TetR family transcriptional regulator [Citricoccus sp. WCRC_4]